MEDWQSSEKATDCVVSEKGTCDPKRSYIRLTLVESSGRMLVTTIPNEFDCIPTGIGNAQVG
jgi:hypothetical protein